MSGEVQMSLKVCVLRAQVTPSLDVDGRLSIDEHHVTYVFSLGPGPLQPFSQRMECRHTLD